MKAYHSKENAIFIICCQNWTEKMAKIDFDVKGVRFLKASIQSFQKIIEPG